MMPRLVIAALAVTFLVSGCTPSTPAAKPDPSPSASPLFASDEEALAAATAAYAAYSAASDEITSQDGIGSERIAPFVTKDQLARDQDVFEAYVAKGIATVGETKFDSLKIQSQEVVAGNRTEVVSYLCADYSAIRLVDASGTDITPSSLDVRSPLEITFISASDNSKLLVEKSEQWAGSNFC